MVTYNSFGSEQYSASADVKVLVTTIDALGQEMVTL